MITMESILPFPTQSTPQERIFVSCHTARDVILSAPPQTKQGSNSRGNLDSLC